MILPCISFPHWKSPVTNPSTFVKESVTGAREGPDMVQHVRAFGNAPGPTQGCFDYLADFVSLADLPRPLQGAGKARVSTGGNAFRSCRRSEAKSPLNSCSAWSPATKSASRPINQSSDMATRFMRSLLSGKKDAPLETIQGR